MGGGGVLMLCVAVVLGGASRHLPLSKHELNLASRVYVCRRRRDAGGIIILSEGKYG